jgi:hypothetical protein
MNRAANAVMVIVGALLMFVGAGMYLGYQVVIQSKEQAESNGTLLRVLLAVSGCTAEDTPEECTERQAERSRLEGVLRVADVDCRLRRALAGLPPATVCVPE